MVSVLPWFKEIGQVEDKISGLKKNSLQQRRTVFETTFLTQDQRNASGPSVDPSS